MSDNLFNCDISCAEITFPNHLSSKPSDDTLVKINLKLEKLPEIICEPGRAIVAESGSTIVRVNLRKKEKLYINDGTYGTLFDGGVPIILKSFKPNKDI